MFNVIFKEFDAIHREYAHSYSNYDKGKFDLAYFYNERANISILAGAIWRQSEYKALVLEEYSTDKEKQTDDNKDINARGYRGRRDLWFCLNEQQFRCEAKQLWWSLESLNEHDFSSAIKLADREANKIERQYIDGDNFALGIVFITFKIRRTNLGKGSSCLAELDRLIARYQQDDLITHKLVLDEVLRSGGESTTLYPGVLVLLKSRTKAIHNEPISSNELVGEY
ncbi:hypothetical protein [Vibrio antiquarius]|uniref:hypothetical protein n=1 Tax=Vibrio antiquarius (strain Ex25) TaxID=150340 RepID=UPI0009413F00|nr:hypothetical protein [Vibrio antiquarius]OKQ15661.1 hypothetical protein H058_24060 [Vibrio antiquarius]